MDSQSDSPDENIHDWSQHLANLSPQSNSTNNNCFSAFTNGKVTNSRYSQCQHALPSIVEPIYEQFNNHQVIVSGPEFTFDVTYFLVHQNEDLLHCEREINLSEFCHSCPVDKEQQKSEFRIIQKFTSHKDHANNFFVSANNAFFKLNRHKDLLPYKHSRVILQKNPYRQTEPNYDDDQFTYDQDEKELQTYVSACFINSHVRDFGKAFIAA